MALPTRNIVDWEPRRVRAALEGTITGSLQAPADLCADIMRDARVRGVFSTRTLGMLGLPLSWEPIEPDGWYELAPEAELNRLLSWGLMLGVGFARIRPDGSLETWHPRWFRWDWSEHCWYALTDSGEIRITPGFGWIVYTPYGELEPWNEGLWTCLAIPWLVKRFAVHDRARASEVFGSAMVVGTASEGATEEQRSKWLSELGSLSRSSRLVLPQGFSLDLLEAQGQTSRIYDSAQQWADTEMTIAIAGQLVTTEGMSGFSRGDVHQAIAASLISFGAESFSSCLSKQYIATQWYIDTYPQWDTESPERAAQRSDGVKAFGEAVQTANAALASYGVRIDAKAMAEAAGIPIIQLPPDTSTGAVKLEFAPTDIVRFVRVNEARVSKGLPPLDPDDPLGKLFIADLQTINPTPADEAVSAEADTGEAPMAIAASTPRIAASTSRSMPGLILCRGLGIDVSRAPTEFRMFAHGRNESDHGPFKVTERSVELLLADQRDVMIDLEHLSLNQESANYNPDAMGWGRLERRDDGLYVTNVSWTVEGKERIESRKQRYISPAFWTNSKKEVVRLTNVALTALPAMHHVEALIAASTIRRSPLLTQASLRMAARKFLAGKAR